MAAASTTQLESEYDFVILGGGTAGLTLAARLSENPRVTVAVIEAGEDHLADPHISTPALWPSLLGSDVDWSFVSEPQKGLNGNRITIPHGRALGGSSAINGQAFVATSKIGVDSWGALGNPGWSWDVLAPYYRKSYTLTVPRKPVVDHLGLGYIDESIRGNKGPIQASFPDDLDDPLPKAWLDALAKLGYPTKGDPFSGQTYGAYTNACSIDPKTRTRSYSATGYWEPIKERPNLHVLTGAHIQKLVLDASGSEVVAKGAEYLKDSAVRQVHARKEVISCAGTFHSPKLLELSGIGSKEILSKFGIPVVIENPYVGENLQDQTMSGFSFEVRDGLKTKDDLSRQDPDAIAAAMQAFQDSQKGPFTIGGVFSYAFLPVIDFVQPGGDEELAKAINAASSYRDPHPLAKDHAAFVHELLQNPHEGSGGFFTYPAQGNFGNQGGEGAGAELVQTLMPGNFYTIAVSIMHPLSRGSTHIPSADPAAKVATDPRYLTHPLDLEVFARHLRYIWKIKETEPLRGLLKEGGVVNAAAPKLSTDLDAIKDYAKRAGLSSWHPTSTCAMLPREKGGVVDPTLVVYGTSNLRVVDASVMPITPRGNPQSSVYAIAERAADLIKEKHGL